jgi:hypothetical protein
LEDISIDGRTILNRILRKLAMGWAHLAWDRPVISFCKYCNVPSGSIKGGEILN